MVNGWYRCLTKSGTGGFKDDWIMTFHIFLFHQKGMSSVFLIDEVHDFSWFFNPPTSFFKWKIYGQRRLHQEEIGISSRKMGGIMMVSFMGNGTSVEYVHGIPSGNLT